MDSVVWSIAANRLLSCEVTRRPGCRRVIPWAGFELYVVRAVLSSGMVRRAWREAFM